MLGFTVVVIKLSIISINSFIYLQLSGEGGGGGNNGRNHARKTDTKRRQESKKRVNEAPRGFAALSRQPSPLASLATRNKVENVSAGL